jgi:hypothetical protein
VCSLHRLLSFAAPRADGMLIVGFFRAGR